MIRFLFPYLLLVLFGVLIAIKAILVPEPPCFDTPIPTEISAFTKPTKQSNIGLSAGLNLDSLNAELQKHVGTTVTERTGISVKVRVIDAIISMAEDAAIKTWHESKCSTAKIAHESRVAAIKIWCDGKILACNRHFRSSHRRRCRNETYADKDRRIGRSEAEKKRKIAEYTKEKHRRISHNSRPERIFDVVASSGKDNYLIATARLDAINISSLEDRLAVSAKLYCKAKVNIENPFDHSKEFKGLINEDLNISVGVSGNIEFTEEGKIKLTNRKVLFSPRFSMPSVLKPLQSVADKLNTKIEEQVSKQIDRQLSKFNLADLANKELTKLTTALNARSAKENLWVLPNISQLSFRTNNQYAKDPKMVGINLGVVFEPQIIYSKQRPKGLGDFSYDVNLTNDHSGDYLFINTGCFLHLPDVSKRLTKEIQSNLNKWSKNNADSPFSKFSISKVTLHTAQNKVVVVLHTESPIRGSIALSTVPILEKRGRVLRFSEVELYGGTREALTEKVAWLAKIPFPEILEDHMIIDVAWEADKALENLRTNGINLGSTGTLRLTSPDFSLVRLEPKNGNLLLEMQLISPLTLD